MTDPLVCVALGALVGALLAPIVDPTPELFVRVAFLAALLAVGLLTPLDTRVVLVAATSVLMLAVTWAVMLNHQAVAFQDEVELTGVVASLPERVNDQPRVEVQITQASVPALTGRRITVTLDRGVNPAVAHRVQCRCRRIGELTVDRRTLSRWANGSEALVEATDFAIADLDPSPRWWLLRARSAIVDRTDRLWPLPESSLAAGLVVGSREQFSPALAAAMTRTGTTHLVAVSGTNVAIVVWVLGHWISRRRPWLRIGVVGIALVLFSVLTGGTASVLRAGVTAWLLAVADGLGRPTNALRLLIVVGGFLAVLNPLAVSVSLGFQLSFLAVFGLVVFSGPLAAWLPGPRWLRDSVAATVAATVATGPLVAGSFGTVSVIAPLANLAVLGVTLPAMLVAAVILILSFVVPIASSFLGWLSWPVLALVTSLIEGFGSIPWASLTISRSTTVSIIGTTLIIVVGTWLALRGRRDDGTLGGV